MTRSRLIPAVLCLAGLFAVAGMAEAAPRGGGGAYRGGPAYGYRGGYYHGGYFYGPGFGFGLGFYPYYYGAGPYWYNPIVVAPGYPYVPPAVVVQGQPEAPPPPQATPGEPAPKNAQIKVLVPDAQAKVWFDGNPTSSTGTERLFHTPDLAPGATSTYKIRARWTANGQQFEQELIVPVQAGRGSVADFTRPKSEGVPPPPK